jgi:hypothetical protein
VSGRDEPGAEDEAGRRHRHAAAANGHDAADHPKTERAKAGRGGAVASPRVKPETSAVDRLADSDVDDDRDEATEQVTETDPAPVRTNVIPRGDISELRRREPEESPLGRRRRFGPAARRVKRTVRHVDPISVLKLSLIFYGCFLLIGLVGVAIVYAWLEGMGLFDAVEDFARGSVLLAKGESLGITLWVVERWAFLIGLTLGVLASLVNVFLAVLYNLASDLVGGVGLTFVERDL